MGKYCVWYQNRSLGRWPVNHIRSQARGITSTTGCIGELGFDPVETVGYGPTMWVKSRKGGDVLYDHVGNTCQRIACQLRRQQRRYQGRGTKRTIFLLVERGGPVGKVLVHRWLPNVINKSNRVTPGKMVHRGVYISRDITAYII